MLRQAILTIHYDSGTAFQPGSHSLAGSPGSVTADNISETDVWSNLVYSTCTQEHNRRISYIHFCLKLS